MPGKETKHTAKWDRCVKKVKDKSPDANAYAICSSSIKDGGVKKAHQKKNKEDYYSNRKKAMAKEKKNEMITNFNNFVNENYDVDEQYWYRVKELVDKFRELYTKPLDMMDEVREDNSLSDIIIDFLEDEKDGMIFFEPVVEELIKLEYGEVWKEL